MQMSFGEKEDAKGSLWRLLRQENYCRKMVDVPRFFQALGKLFSQIVDRGFDLSVADSFSVSTDEECFVTIFTLCYIEKRRYSRLSVRVFCAADSLVVSFHPTECVEREEGEPSVLTDEIAALAHRVGITISTVGEDLLLSLPHCYAEECASYVCAATDMYRYILYAIWGTVRDLSTGLYSGGEGPSGEDAD